MEYLELLTRWTVRVALVAYVLFLVHVLRRGRLDRAARAAWTIGCAAMLVHVFCAFHFIHQWSHAEAYEITARRTAEVIGVSFGGGVFVNHVFLLVWTADVLWWWIRPAGYLSRPRWIGIGMQSFCMVMAVSGAIVFEPGPTRPVGVVVCIVLAALSWRALKRSRRVAVTGSGLHG